MQALFCTGIAFLPRSMLRHKYTPCVRLRRWCRYRRVYVPPQDRCVPWFGHRWSYCCFAQTTLNIQKVLFYVKKWTTLWARTCVEPLILLNMYSTKTIHKNINPHYPQGYTSIGDPYSGNNDTLPSRWKEKQFVTQRFPKVSSFSCMQRWWA